LSLERNQRTSARERLLSLAESRYLPYHREGLFIVSTQHDFIITIPFFFPPNGSSTAAILSLFQHSTLDVCRGKKVDSLLGLSIGLRNQRNNIKHDVEDMKVTWISSISTNCNN
jgi:hypothetical protein